jgi:excisionase family DNA binding protein
MTAVPRPNPAHVSPRLLTTTEVAARFGVDTNTVRRWADRGWLTRIRTPGGHRRYRAAEVEALRRGGAR